MNIYLIITIVVVLVLVISLPLGRRMVVNSVENSLLQGNFDKFDKQIKRWYIKIFIQPFNVDFLKLNRAILSEDKEMTDEMFEHFDHVNLNEDQKEQVYYRGFQYYVTEGNRKMSDKYYDLIKDLSNEDLINYVDRLYDVYVRKGWKYLDEMIDEVQEDDGLTKDEQLEHYSMISTMYDNKGDKKNADKYMDIITSEFDKDDA